MTKHPGIDLVGRARALQPLITRDSDEIERTRRLTPAVTAGLIENGLYRVLLPQSLGGAEAPLDVFMQMQEEIAKADASTAWCLGQCAVCAMTAAYLDADVANEIFNTPPGILAGARSPTRSRRFRAAIRRRRAGISPRARGRRAGSARMCGSSRPTARHGRRKTARRKSVLSCFRSKAPPCTMSGT